MKKGFYDVKDAGQMFLWVVIFPQLLGTLFSLLIVLCSSWSGLSATEILNISYDIYLGTMIMQIGFFCVWFFLSRNHDIKRANRIRPLSLKNVLICIGIGIVAMFALNPISNCFVELFNAIGFKLDTSMPFTPNGFGSLIGAIFFFALVPAVLEELVFRGAILNGLLKFGKWPAILISAGLFALIHGNLHQLGYTFLFAIILGIVVLKTGSIFSSMIIHFVSNATTIIMYYFTYNPDVVAEPFTISFAYVVIAIALAVALFALVLFVIRFMSQEKSKLEKPDLIKDLNKIVLSGNNDGLTQENKINLVLEQMDEIYAKNEGKSLNIKEIEPEIVVVNNDTGPLKLGIVAGIIVLILNIIFTLG